jgi:predicted kinase
MIIGLPGAGKSYFAGHFSDTFGAPLVSHDKLQFELFDTPKHTPAEYGLISRLAELQLAELVKTHASILIDGFCNSRKERIQLEQFAANHNYDTLIVWVQTDEPTAKTRATTRNAKRPGDERNPRLTAEQYTTFSGRLVAPLKQEQYVVISGKHTYTTQARMVLRKLAAPRIEKAEAAHLKEAEQTRSRTAPTTRTVPVPARRNVIIR